MRELTYYGSWLAILIFNIWQGIIINGTAFSSLNFLYEIFFGESSSVTSGSEVFDLLTMGLSYIIDIFLLAPFYNAFAPILDVLGFFGSLKGLEVYVRAGSILIALLSYPFMLILKFFDPHE